MSTEQILYGQMRSWRMANSKIASHELTVSVTPSVGQRFLAIKVCMVPYCPVWFPMILYGPAWSSMVLHGPVWGVVSYCPVWAHMVPYGPVWSQLVSLGPIYGPVHSQPVLCLVFSLLLLHCSIYSYDPLLSCKVLNSNIVIYSPS